MSQSPPRFFSRTVSVLAGNTEQYGEATDALRIEMRQRALALREIVGGFHIERSDVDTHDLRLVAAACPTARILSSPPGRSIVAVNALAAFVALLRLDRQRCDRARFEPLDRDRLAGLLAIAVGAVFDALQRRVDLGN